jgi:hypothetical protein
MTLCVAWIRQAGDNEELVFATDSTLTGGEKWNRGIKLFELPRKDCLVSKAEVVRDLENTKIPFIVSLCIQTGGVEHEDICFESQQGPGAGGGIDFSFG